MLQVPLPKPKVKGKAKAKVKARPSLNQTPPNRRIPRTRGGTSTSQGDGKKGPCIFFPKGLCRRGTGCPYRHEGTPAADPKAKAKPAAVAKPKAAAMVALVGSVIGGAAAYVPPTVQEVYQVEWARDSGAGEHLASREALVHQGIPQSVIEECETTCSSKPLTFSTGGGLKEADVTIKTQGDLLGDGIVYMLRKCHWGSWFNQDSLSFGVPIMNRHLSLQRLVSMSIVTSPNVLLLIELNTVFQFSRKRFLLFMGFLLPPDQHLMRGTVRESHG